MQVTCELINGLVFGLEHMNASEDTEGLDYMIIVHFAVFRFCFIKFS